MGDAIALCSELLGPLPPPTTPFFIGDTGGLMLVSLEAEAPNKRSCALNALFGLSTPLSLKIKNYLAYIIVNTV
jgi:hypothetical protein